MNIGLIGSKDGPTAVYWSKRGDVKDDKSLEIALFAVGTALALFIIHILKRK